MPPSRRQGACRPPAGGGTAGFHPRRPGLAAFSAKRYRETLVYLDQRAQLQQERIDLMVLRGYSYLNLQMYGDAPSASSMPRHPSAVGMDIVASPDRKAAAHH